MKYSTPAISMGDGVTNSQSGSVTFTQAQLFSSCYRCKRKASLEEIYTDWLPEQQLIERCWHQCYICPRCARWKPRYWILMRWHLRIGRISDWFAPYYSACFRCHTNWHYAKEHNTTIKQGSGMFPLCEKCWRELTPKQRLPFYLALYREWNGHSFSETDVIAAVLAEET